MSRIIDDTDVELSEQEKAKIRAELILEEATLQLLDIRFEATGRKTRLEKIRRLKGAIAVHKRCPVEIWEQIFDRCCHPDALLDTDADETAKHPLFTLIRVCSLWRKVVLSAPNLWKKIRAHNDERGLALATRWFSRAGSIPRSLSLVSRGGPLIGFQQLISQYPFQSLDIKALGIESSEVLDFSQIPVGSLLPLERLLLNFNHTNTTDSTLLPSLSLASHSLPNLTCLHVGRGVEMPQFHIRDPFTTWSQLREIHLHCPLLMIKCLSILRHCRGIETCSMHIAETPFSRQANGATNRITLPNLVSLTLNFGLESDMNKFFHSFILPNLNSLTLGDEGWDSLGHPSCRPSIFERIVKCSRIRHLEELRIHVPIFNLHFGNILGLLPCLRHLTVSLKPVLDWDAAQRIATGKLGPRLREFRIHETIEDHEIDRLLNMFESREKTCWETSDVSRIRHISFRVRDTVADREEIERRIDRLKKLGVDVTVVWTRARS